MGCTNSSLEEREKDNEREKIKKEKVKQKETEGNSTVEFGKKINSNEIIKEQSQEKLQEKYLKL